MEKSEIEAILRYRYTIVDNLQDIINKIKKNKLNKNKNVAQLSLFDNDEFENYKDFKLKINNDNININKIAEIETELLGIPITYDPLNEYDFYKEIICTNEVTDILNFTSDINNIIIIDRITKIDCKISKTGNKYAKVHISKLPSLMYMYLTGKNFEKYIHYTFINNIYLFEVNYRTASPTFTVDSISISHLKHIEDVDINKFYNKMINSMKITSELNEPWMIKNRKNEN